MRLHLITLACLLALLGTLCGCSGGSSFWDRSPCVASARTPQCTPPPTARNDCGCPPVATRQAAPGAQPADPLAPPVVRQARPDATFAARPPAIPRTDIAGPTAADMDVLQRVNAIRYARGIRPLAFNGRLWVAARDHSLEQMQHGYMGHGSPDPKRDELIERMHISEYAGRAYGEVVAWGYRDTRSVVEGWMNSPPHRAVLIDPDLVEAAFNSAGLYWTGNFGAPDFRRRAALSAPRVTTTSVPSTPPARKVAPTPAPRPTVAPAPAQPPRTPTRRAAPKPTPQPAPQRKFIDVPKSGFG